MKIVKEEFQKIGEESPLELFHQGIKSKETREKYTRTLCQVLCNIFEDLFEGEFEDRVNQFVKLAKEDPDWTRDLLINLSIKLKERTKLERENPEHINPSSIDNYFKPIKKLFDMSGNVISWNRIYATFPEQNNISDSRRWSRDETQKMLKFTNGSIDRAIILPSAGSGIRTEGFDLNWQDLTPVYSVDGQLKFEITEEEYANIACAMIRIYQGTSEGYPAFITPEAYDALMDYKSDWAKDMGGIPRPEDPIFKKRNHTQKNNSNRS